MASGRNAAKRVYSWAYAVKRLGALELSRPRLTPWPIQMWCWAHGFFSACYVLYSLGQNPWQSYISDLAENLRAYRINGRDRWFLENKILFWNLMAPHVATPGPVALISKGDILALGAETSVASRDSLLAWLGEVQDAFVKPYDGASGLGVHRVLRVGDQWELDGEPVHRGALDETLAGLDGYLVTRAVKAGSYSREIFAGTTNTVRILTMIDPDLGEPFIAAAAHRIGTKKSVPVDNCAAGGLTAAIDLETGRLGPAVSTKVTVPTLRWYHRHPDSGAPIDGVQVPGWEETKALVLRLARVIKRCPYVGWDLVITDSGIVVLEGNDGPDLKLHQVHRPLLADPRVRRFYERHGVVRG